jgi:hypothetical protein
MKAESHSLRKHKNKTPSMSRVKSPVTDKIDDSVILDRSGIYDCKFIYCCLWWCLDILTKDEILVK